MDNARNPFGRMLMCHMIADTLEELHDMASRIGMRREWFQPGSTPHYDVCLSRRILAVKEGAIEVSQREIVAIIRRLRIGTPLVDPSSLRAQLAFAY